MVPDMGVRVIESLTSRVLPPRSEPVRAVIVHTTGDTDVKRILRFYHAPDGLQPHYMITVDGTVYQTAHETEIAYHCKIDPAEARLYRLGFSAWSHWVWLNERPVDQGQEQPRYLEWKERWIAAGKQSPLDLVTGDHPNGRSVGVELQQPEKPGGDIFTDAQYTALAPLVADIGNRHGLRLDRVHVLGHYDCSPMRRANASGNWDPGRAFSWNRLWDGLRRLAPIT